MVSTHSTQMERETGKAATLADLKKSGARASMPLDELKNIKERTGATMLKDSPKTWKKTELAALESKAGLVAGAIADFQSAGGLVVMTQEKYKTSSGTENKAIKLLLLVRDVDLVAERTVDGIDFCLVAESEKE